MIIIEKALGKENIDEVVTLSRELREKDEGLSSLIVSIDMISLMHNSDYNPRDQVSSTRGEVQGGGN
jgi:hypothetical protein